MNRNTILFYMYRISSRLYFHLPVLFVFFIMQQLRVHEAELLLAVYGLAILASAKGNAWLMRWLSHKWVIAIGESFKALGLGLMVLSQGGIGLLVAAQVASGLGYSLAAGTDVGLLRTLFADQEQAQYQKTEARSGSYMFLSVLGSGIVGSMAFGFNTVLPFVVSIISCLCSVAAILAIHAPFRPARQTGEAPARGANPVPDAGHGFWRGYYALSRAFVLAPFVGFLPLFLYLVLHLDLFWFGLVLSLFTITGFFTGRQALRLAKCLGDGRLAVLGTAGASLALGLFALAALAQPVSSAVALVLALVAITFLGGSSGLVRPLALAQLNTGGSAPAERVALLSSLERHYGFWNALILIVGGFLVEAVGFTPMMLGLGITLPMALGTCRLIAARKRGSAAGETAGAPASESA